MTTTDTLLEQYQVDTAHARYVADLALALFDASQRLHHLAGDARRLLETGALLHNLGVEIDQRKHHTLGRDIVLSTELEGLDDDERALIACLVAFHRKKVQPKLEPAFLRLGKQKQAAALQLAAILRVADGLDYSQSQSTVIEATELEHGRLKLRLSGPAAAVDHEQALAKADLWRKTFGHALTITAPEQAADMAHNGSANGNGASTIVLPPFDGPPPSIAALELPKVEEPQAFETPWKLQPEDTLRSAARKMLRRYFQKLLSQEAEVRESEDPEGVHQMRVATRRLRATLSVLGAAIGQKQAQDFRRSIRAIAQTLGEVRDRDVFLEHVRSYDASLDEAQRGGVAPLIAALERDQARAKEHLLDELGTKRYARFKRTCATFLTASDQPNGAQQLGPEPRIRYAAGSAIWQGYETLRAYETLLPATAGLSAETDMELLHEMRIAGKHFRYTLELFSDALGPKVDGALDPLLALQEHLGALQDIEVAVAYVHAMPTQNGSHAALEAYVAARHADRDRLLAELPRYWEKVASATYRRRLMELIVKL